MTDLAALLFLGGSAVFDFRTRKVPNRWLALWILLWMAAVIPFSGQPPSAELWFIFRAAGAVFLLFPVFRFRMAGAGDVKTAALLAGMLGASGQEGRCFTDFFRRRPGRLCFLCGAAFWRREAGGLWNILGRCAVLRPARLRRARRQEDRRPTGEKGRQRRNSA